MLLEGTQVVTETGIQGRKASAKGFARWAWAGTVLEGPTLSF